MDQNPPEEFSSTSSSTSSGSSSAMSLFDNPISVSVIVSAFIIAISIIVGAYMIRGGLAQGALNAAAAVPGAPGSVVKVVNRSDQPVIGNPSAKVTVYEFGDFQCPYCKSFYSQSFADIKTKYIDTGKVNFVFRHYPLSQIHVNAEISSEAAECANRQGKFEDFYNTLYTKGQADGTGLDAASLKGYAANLGLNTTVFNQCLDNHETQAVIATDLAEGNRIGISGTPSFVIAGQLLVGAQPAANFEQAIDAALAK